MSAPDPPPNFASAAFSGLAGDYVRYRLPYPATLVDRILAATALEGPGRLLDLGCGAGRVALQLAAHFQRVDAVDPESEMIAAGRREAERLGVINVDWFTGRAEDFKPPTTYDLVTAGEAFHRFDRPLVARRVLGWLTPGGALVTLGGGNFMEGDAPWRRRLADVVRTFVGEPARRLGAPNAALAQEIADQSQVLRDAEFAQVDDFALGVQHEWTLEALLGNLRSTSVLSRRALGARHATFEATLSEQLRACEPGGRFVEEISYGFTIARKARASAG